jgi:hypothetical protein
VLHVQQMNHVQANVAVRTIKTLLSKRTAVFFYVKYIMIYIAF